MSVAIIARWATVDFPTAVFLKIQVFWVLKLCRRASNSRHFDGGSVFEISGITEQIKQSHLSEDLHIHLYVTFEKWDLSITIFM